MYVSGVYHGIEGWSAALTPLDFRRYGCSLFMRGGLRLLCPSVGPARLTVLYRDVADHDVADSTVLKALVITTILTPHPTKRCDGKH
jgi:hypothetical protein